ncbi:MAG: M14 family metallopeptidase [Bacteroides sp.]
MEKELIYRIPSIYRDDFCIHGYRFGSGEKELCIVGSMRGNEYQQIYTCSQLIQRLMRLEKAGMLYNDKEILVIPSLNPCSMNIEKRFWPTDNTDINRMFPGYTLGETTQRIAAGVFEKISAYKNGIQFPSFYMPGKFCPHVRMMKTGYENVEKARQFGLPYIVLKVPKPYDTTTLNYNWQIWETDAFSLYGTSTDQLDEKSTDELIECILRFMSFNGLIKDYEIAEAQSHVFLDREMLSVRPEKSGIYKSMISVQDKVKKGQLLAYILDSCVGDIIEELHAPADGVVFFAHDKPLVYANTAVIKILPVC